jgi:hypothetical protein
MFEIYAVLAVAMMVLLIGFIGWALGASIELPEQIVEDYFITYEIDGEEFAVEG